MTKNDTLLLDCPFCGNKAIIAVGVDDDDSFYSAQCSNTYCISRCAQRTKEKAIELYNKRMNWIDIAKELPKEDKPYLIHAPSMDEKKPLIKIAWYNPKTGWSLLPECWIDAITHWMPLPIPPEMGVMKDG
jgi:transcription elongation factor Elf1